MLLWLQCLHILLICCAQFGCDERLGITALVDCTLDGHCTFGVVDCQLMQAVGEKNECDVIKPIQLEWATPIEFHTPPLEDLMNMLHRGSVNS